MRTNNATQKKKKKKGGTTILARAEGSLHAADEAHLSRHRGGEQTKISKRGIIYRGKIIARVFFIQNEARGRKHATEIKRKCVHKKKTHIKSPE